MRSSSVPSPVAAPTSTADKLHDVAEQALITLAAPDLQSDRSKIQALNSQLTEWFQLVTKLDFPHDQKVVAAKALRFYRESFLAMPLMTARELRRQTQYFLKLVRWSPTPATCVVASVPVNGDGHGEQQQADQAVAAGGVDSSSVHGNATTEENDFYLGA